MAAVAEVTPQAGRGGRRLTRLEEVRLARRIERGDLQAKERLVLASTPLVPPIASRYRNQGLPWADLIQEGCIGLIRAAERYDHRLGHRFSTYATWWIRQAIARAVAIQGRTIRLPVPVAQKLRRVNGARALLAAELGRTPTAADVAARSGLKAAEVESVTQAAREVVSLDGPRDAGDAGSLVDLVAAPGGAALGEADPGPTSQLAATLLGSLSATERRVVVLRYGLDGGAPHPLASVGRELRLSTWRVRSIEHASLDKLRRALAGEATEAVNAR